MKRSRWFFTLSALITLCLTLGCARDSDAVKREKAAARQWYERQWQQRHPCGRSRATMSVVGYGPVRIDGHRKDRGELSLDKYMGQGPEIPAPPQVLRNPARVQLPVSRQGSVMQLKRAPRQRVPDEVLF